MYTHIHALSGLPLAPHPALEVIRTPRVLAGYLAQPLRVPPELLLLALEQPLGRAQALQVALVGVLPLLQLIALALQVLAAAPQLVLALRQARLALLQRSLAGLPLALVPPLLLLVMRLLPLQVGQVLPLLLQAALLLLLDEGAGPRRRPRERPLAQQQLLVLDVAVLLQHHTLRGDARRGDAHDGVMSTRGAMPTRGYDAHMRGCVPSPPGAWLAPTPRLQPSPAF